MSSCEIFGPDKVDRTPSLPASLDLPVVDLQSAVYDPTVPDSINSKVVVAGIAFCPPRDKCQFFADGIFVTGVRRTADERIHIGVQNPHQFYVDRVYILSLWRSGPYDVAGVERYSLHILGFDAVGR